MDVAFESRGDATAIARPSGRLDLVSANSFREAVRRCIDGGRRVVVVDLAGVTFIDSTGLGALVGCLKHARQASGDLRIACAGEQVTMVLELTQLHRVLRPHADVESALGVG